MTNLDHVEILLVEDSDEDAELAIRALHKHRLANQVHRVVDGVEALEFLATTGHRPKLVLLDLKLPRIDGLEVLRRMKSDPATQPIPVVVLTSSREDRDLIDSYRLGVNSYIVKPVDFEKFVDAVGQLGLYWAVLNEQRQK
jgi:two-component system, response regulator